MARYQCFLLDNEGRARGVGDIDSAAQPDAETAAVSMLDRLPSEAAVELWHNGRKVFRGTRDAVTRARDARPLTAQHGN